MDASTAGLRLGPAERFAWLALVLTVAFVLLVGGTYPTMGSPSVRAITQVLVGGLLVSWVVLGLRRPWWLPQKTGLIIVLPGLAAAGLSVLASSVPRLALEALYWASLWAALFLLLTRVASHPRFRPRVRGLLILLYLFVLFGYGGQLAVLWAEWISVAGRVVPLPLHPAGASLTFGAAPAVATFLLVLGPVAGALLAKERFGSLIIFALTVLTLVTVLATGSRAAYLAAGAEGVAVVFVLGRGGLASVVRTVPRPLLAITVGLALVLGGALFASLGARLLDSSTLSERWDIWKSALAIWERSPWFGAGAGTWPFLRAGAYPVGAASLVVPHAHNPLIQLLAECGVVGVISVGLGVLVMVRALAAEARGGSEETRRVAAASLVGLTGFAAASVLDDFVNLPAVLLGVALPVAWVLGGRQGAEERVPSLSPAGRLVPLPVAAALIVVVAFSGGQRWTQGDPALG